MRRPPGREAFPGDIFVDCAEPSCAITSPNPTTGFLNLGHDENLSMGPLQTTVEVTSVPLTVRETSCSGVLVLIDRLNGDEIFP